MAVDEIANTMYVTDSGNNLIQVFDMQGNYKTQFGVEGAMLSQFDFPYGIAIYNSQLCVLPESLWKYCRKSISDWKNSYLPECEKCNKFQECGGLFTWNLAKHSEYIKAFC